MELHLHRSRWLDGEISNSELLSVVVTDIERNGISPAAMHCLYNLQGALQADEEQEAP
jgi:hypothetical protein